MLLPGVGSTGRSRWLSGCGARWQTRSPAASRSRCRPGWPRRTGERSATRELFRAADGALLDAKREGRNRSRPTAAPSRARRASLRADVTLSRRRCRPCSREPDPFLDTFTGLVAARAVTTAVMLGVFEALHEEPASAAELADRLELDPLGAETLLTALLTLGYVEVRGRAILQTRR